MLNENEEFISEDRINECKQSDENDMRTQKGKAGVRRERDVKKTRREAAHNLLIRIFSSFRPSAGAEMGIGRASESPRWSLLSRSSSQPAWTCFTTTREKRGKGL